MSAVSAQKSIQASYFFCMLDGTRTKKKFKFVLESPDKENNGR
jgi:predicted transcriptional regulator